MAWFHNYGAFVVCILPDSFRVAAVWSCGVGHMLLLFSREYAFFGAGWGMWNAKVHLTLQSMQHALDATLLHHLAC